MIEAKSGGGAEAHLRRAYLQALVRSQRAVARMLETIASLVGEDRALARKLAERPEELAALVRGLEAAGAPFGVRLAHARGRRHGAARAPAPPLLLIRRRGSR